jgi:hypothetical protein
MKEQEIIFTLTVGEEWIPSFYYPIPASKQIPEWYKKMDSYYHKTKNNSDKKFAATMKRCMPVFDSLTAGYLLLLHTDLTITKQEDGINYQFHWAHDVNPSISFHDKAQLEGYKELEVKTDAPKLRNPWAIKTPKGYSCLFIPPMHRGATGIRILEGVVDTDGYTNSVQFPFMVDEGFEGDIPAGTPIAQVIPFKRENFKMRIGDFKEQREAFDILKIVTSVWVNGYRNMFRKEKRYL